MFRGFGVVFLGINGLPDLDVSSETWEIQPSLARREAHPLRHPALKRLCENPCVRGSKLVY